MATITALKIAARGVPLFCLSAFLGISQSQGAAECAGVNDPSFEPALVGYFKGMVLDGDEVVAASDFTVVRFGPDGKPDFDSTTAVFHEYGGAIQAIAKDSAGGILLGGPKWGLLRVLRTGKFDNTFFQDTSLTNVGVNAIQLQTDGKILIGGIEEAQETNRVVMRLNANGAADLSFARAGLDGNISAMAVQGDGRVLVAGMFTNVNGQGRHQLCRLMPDGALDETFAPEQIMPSIVGVVALADGKILIHGDGWWSVTEPELSSRPSTHNLARLNADGSVDKLFVTEDRQMGPYKQVTGMAVQPDGKYIITGLLSDPELPYTFCKRIFPDGAEDPSFRLRAFPASSGWSGRKESIALDDQQRILIGGYFAYENESTFGKVRRFLNDSSPCVPVISYATNEITFVEANGAMAIPLERTGDISLPTSVQIYIPPHSRHYLGDPFPSIQTNISFAPGVTRQDFLIPLKEDSLLLYDRHFHLLLTNVAPGSSVGFRSRIDVTIKEAATVGLPGSIDPTFIAPDYGRPWPVGLATMPDGKIVVALNPEPIHADKALTRLNKDGSIDPLFRPPSLHPTHIALRGDKLYVAHTNGANRLTRLLADGSVDSAFSQPEFSGPGDFQLTALFVDATGKALVAGNFTNANGTARATLARIDATGSLDVSFNVGEQSPIGVNDSINRIVGLPDGTYVVGGAFTNFHGQLRLGVAHLSATGALLEDFTLSDSFTGNMVTALAVQPDGRVLVGRSSPGYVDLSAPTLFRFTASGELDPSFTLAATENGRAFSDILIQANGKIIAVGGLTCRRFAPDGKLDDAFLFGEEAGHGPAVIDADQNLYLWFNNYYPYNTPKATLVRARTHDYTGPGSFSMHLVNYYLKETDGPAKIIIRRIWSTQGEARVRVKTGLTTAVANRDYIPLDQVVVFADGESEKQVEIQIIDNNEALPYSALLNVEISSETPGAPIVGGKLIQFQLIDDENEFHIYSHSGPYDNREGGFATVLVRREGYYCGPATVEVVTEGGTAIPGVDYEPIATTLTFDSEMNMQQGVSFRLLDNNTIDQPKTIGVVLRNATGKGVIGVGTNTVTIYDNAETFLVEVDKETALQIDGSIRLKLCPASPWPRNGGTDSLVRIGYRTAGTAAPGVEYVAQQGVIEYLSFMPATNEIVIPLLANTVVGDPTTLEVQFTVLDGEAVVIPSSVSTKLFHPAAVTPAGSVDLTFPVLTEDVQIRNVASDANYVYVLANWSGDRRLVRFHHSGAVDETFQPDMARVYDHLVPLGGGSLITFDPTTGDWGRRISRLNSTGGVDLSFQMEIPALSSIQRIMAADGKIIISGAIHIGYTLYPFVTQLMPNGALDASFGRIVFPPAIKPLDAIARQSDGRILVIGSFNEIRGNARTNVARLMPNGEVDLSFNAPADLVRATWYNAFNRIWALASGKILVEGALSMNRTLVRLNADGSEDAEQLSYNGSIMAIDAKDRIYLPVYDSNWNQRAIRRLLPNGSPDPNFIGPQAPNAILPTPNGVLAVNYSGWTAPITLVRLYTDPPTMLRAPELLPNGRIAHTFNFPPNTPYALEETSDFVTWTEIQAGTSGEGYVRFETAQPASTRFYRVRSR